MAIDKKKTKFRIKRLSQIKTWQLVILLIMSGFISATFLRLNNVGMVERRESVEHADKAGDIVNLQQRLYDLQRYVSTHMNADPGKIALDHTYKQMYDRKLKEFEEEIKNQSNNDTVSRLGLFVILGRSRAVTADLRHRRIRGISIVLTRSGRNILPRKPLTCSLKRLQPSRIITPSFRRYGQLITRGGLCW